MKFNSIHIFIKRLYAAITSNKRAAYLGLLTLLLTPITRWIDNLLFKKKQNISIREVPNIVLIACSSRNGGTIVSQVLTRIIPSNYISNLTALFPNWAHQYMNTKNYYGTASLAHRNFFGYTSSLWDVNEGNALFHSLFVNNPNKEELRRRFLKLANQLGGGNDKPIIIKNVWSYDRILELYNAVPELKVIRLTRDTEQVAQSMVETYYKLGYFNPIPESCHPENFDHPAKYAVAQIKAVDKIIDDQIDQIPSDSIYRLTYEAFCQNVIFHCQAICDQFLDNQNIELRENVLDHPLKASMRQKVNDEDLRVLRLAIEKVTNA